MRSGCRAQQRLHRQAAPAIESLLGGDVAYARERHEVLRERVIADGESAGPHDHGRGSALRAVRLEPARFRDACSPTSCSPRSTRPIALATRRRLFCDLGDRGLGLELHHRVAEPSEQGPRECVRVRAGDHDVGIEAQQLLGRSVVQRIARGRVGEQRFLRVGREPADRQNLRRVGEREHELVGAQIDRCDRRQRRVGRGRGECDARGCRRERRAHG